MTGLRTRSAVRVTNGALTMSQTSTLWYASTAGCESLDGTDEAAQPPVRRVQAVGVVVPGRPESRRAEPALQRGTPVDAHVTSGGVVVLVGQRPVDGLGNAARHGHRHGAARAQHAGQLAHGRGVVGDVLEHLRCDHPVEGPVREGQRQRVALHRRGRMVRRRSHPPRSWRRACRAPGPPRRDRHRGRPRRPRGGRPRRRGVRTRNPRSSTRSPGPTPSRS